MKANRSSIFSRNLLSLYFGLILVFIPFFTILTIYTSNDGRKQSFDRRPNLELSLGHKIIELKQKLNHIEMLNQKRKLQISELQRKIENCASRKGNWSGRVASKDEQLVNDLFYVPSLLTFLPHFANFRNPLKPALRIISKNLSPNGRTGVSIVMGLPTVKRPVENYLIVTLQGLLDNLGPEEREEAVIVLFIAEQLFNDHIESGLLEVIAPPASYYPDLSNNSLKLTLGDPIERVRWRTKQNLDYAYLMMYCQQKGLFYVQLEDDIITKPNYVRLMKELALKQLLQKKDWFILQFSSLGFIGKMIKSVDLPLFISIFIMFRDEQPVDWLLEYTAKMRYCGLDYDKAKCNKILSKHWLTARPPLFQHIGVHSSLKGKVQKLRERNFGKSSLFVAHKSNPPAVVSTSLKQYQSYSLQRAYKGETFFWAFNPTKNDYVQFNFTPPVVVNYYKFRSGNWEHMSDIFVNTTVEVLPVSEKAPKSALKEPNGYFIVGEFLSLGAAQGNLTQWGKLQAMRLHCHTNSSNWVILSEILIENE
ncbi:Alpha-1:3-mannosyl-glycoprotein 4-beta-N-acetylglucosaminyltransferase B-like protein, partial [Dinothrombium tinctorium]